MLNIDVSKYIKEDIKSIECFECGLHYHDQMISGDDDFYAQFANFDWYYLEQRAEFEIAKKYIENNDSVLEVGSGSGNFAKKIPWAQYTGLELSTNAIKLAKEKNITVRQEFVEEHAINNKNKYDVVCTFEVLEHVENPYNFIQSCLECLKEKGTFIFTVPYSDNFFSQLPNYILNMPPHHLTSWNEKSMRKLGDIFNLKVESIEIEKCEAVHKYNYAQALCLMSIMGNDYKMKMVDLSFQYRLVSKIASLMAKVIVRGLKSKSMLPYGQCITAIYTKN